MVRHGAHRRSRCPRRLARWSGHRPGRADEDVRPYEFRSLHTIPSENALALPRYLEQVGNHELLFTKGKVIGI